MNSALWIVIFVTALVLAGCGVSPSPPTSTPSPSATSDSSASATSSPAAPRELAPGSGPLPAGTYTRAAFRPRVTLELAEGWFVGSLADGFFDVQQGQGTPDVVAVQFARLKGIVRATSTTPAISAKVAAGAIHGTPGVVVVDESDSRLGGLTGLTVVVENQSAAASAILEVDSGTLAIDPERKLWISVFDTPDGVVAVMVGGSVAEWERALSLAEPVLESVVIGG